MSQLKTRLQALSLLDRAFSALTDAELEAAVAALPDDHREAIDSIVDAKEGGFEDPAARTLAMRATAARGRMTGHLEQLATVLCDPCLAKCIEALGDNADNPTEEQLLEVTPAQAARDAAAAAGPGGGDRAAARQAGRRGHQGTPQGRQGEEAGRGPRPSRAAAEGPAPLILCRRTAADLR